MAARRAEDAGPADGGVLRRLRRGKVRGGIRAPARCAVHRPRKPAGAGLACRRLGPDHGADPVAADDRFRDRHDRMGAAGAAGMTALGRHIAARIAATGPMTLAEYMATCLMHPELGYYATRDPFGAQGDFTTAPEISQMFGELIGLCLAQTWLDQGQPAPFTLAEPGPGRGTLMADILRATRGVPGFHDAMRVHLVETSPALRDVQARNLDRDDITWHDTVADLPDGPLYLVA